MSSVRLCSMSFETASGLPEDEVVNVWAFNQTGVGGDVFSNIEDMLTDFYTAAQGGATFNSPWESMSRRLSGTVKLKIVDPLETPPIFPLYENTLTFPARATATGNLPDEVALCLSFKKSPVTGEDPRNRRGRVFIGPLITNVSVGFNDAVSIPRPNPTCIAAFRDAGADLLAAAQASLSYNWVVFSRVDGAPYVVEEGWVDDAFDTIRKRGPRAASRSTF